MARLLIVNGAQAGQMVRVEDGLKVGRSAHTDLQLKDVIVSREHAVITRLQSGDYVLEDLHSRNGTYVNGKEIEQTTLRKGDSIKIGRCEFVFVDDEKSSGSLADEQSTLHITGEGHRRIVKGELNLDSAH